MSLGFIVPYSMSVLLGTGLLDLPARHDAERYASLADSALVAAIIEVESGGRPTAVSGKGAAGLMQLMPVAVAEVQRKYPTEFDEHFRVLRRTPWKPTHRSKQEHSHPGRVTWQWVNVKPRLTSPVDNIWIGTHYLQLCIDHSPGDLTAALIEYNGGNKQLHRYREGANVAPETAQYVLRVYRVLHLLTPETE